MSETETITLSEVIEQHEFNALVQYLRKEQHSISPHVYIQDWLATQPQILARMNQHKLYLSYFAYLLEACLNEMKTSNN